MSSAYKNTKPLPAAQCQEMVVAFFLEHGRRLSLHKGQLFQPEEKGLFLIHKGALKLVRQDESGRQLAFLLNKGEVVGLHAFLKNEYTGFKAWPLDNPTTLVFVSRDKVVQQLEGQPLLAICLIRLAGNHLQDMLTVASEILSCTARQRFAKIVLSIADKFGSDAEGWIPLRLSADDLAGLMGISKTTVYRLMKDLMRDHIIESKGKSIRVADPMKLEQLSMVPGM
jgi:CRP-like cAMP-binding protein